MNTSAPKPIQPRRIRFQATLLPSLAALFGILLTGYLGHWQQGRASEKRALQNSFEARIAAPLIEIAATPLVVDNDLYQRAIVIGDFDAAGQFLIDNKSQDSAVGYHVITPLRIRNSDTWLLVNRGWVARSRDYPRAPSIAVPAGEVVVKGMLVVPSSK